MGLLPSPREQAPDPLWACSRGAVGLPVWRVGPAGIGIYASPFTVMSHPHFRPASPIISLTRRKVKHCRSSRKAFLPLFQAQSLFCLLLPTSLPCVPAPQPPHILPSIVRALRPKAIRQSLGVPLSKYSNIFVDIEIYWREVNMCS